MSRAKQIRVKLIIALTALFSGWLSAQQVPTDLPSKESIDAYLSYLERPGYSAFAISRQGEFGSAWSYGLISAAENAALDDCEKNAPVAPCYIVSVDGQSTRDTMDVKELLAQFEDAKRQQWPSVDFEKVPLQIASNEVQIKQYQRYTSQIGYKAFAASRDGSWGISSAQITDERARFLAMESCRQHEKGGKSCAIIDANNRATMGRITVKTEATELADVILAPAMEESDVRSRERAKTLFKSRWDEYQKAERNKAFAVNNFGAMGMAVEHASSLVAEEAALNTCESYNSIKQSFPGPNSRIAPCYIIATNNFFDVENIDLVEAQE